ncbi:MAG: hypothetical protein AB1782_06475 [Cyanobacteriota bacterium]
MKRIIISLLLFTLVTACDTKSADEKDVETFQNLQVQKREYVKEYTSLIANPDKNKSNLRKLDAKMHDINKKIKKLSNKEHIKNYILGLRQEHKLTRDSGISKGFRNRNRDNDKFDYQVDNVTVLDEEYNFIDKSYRTTDLSDYEDELYNAKLIDDNDLVSEEEGFSDKEFEESIIEEGAVKEGEEDAFNDAMGSDLELEEDVFKD